MSQVVGLEEGQERFLKRLVLNVKRNAKFLLSLEKTVRYIARIVILSARTVDVK